MEQGAPDIVLLDVMMPGMDGFEVCRRIKSNPKTAHVPVVMVTALDQPSDRVTGLDAGADDFLTKPVDDAALFARVRSLVRLKMMTDELRMRESTGQGMGLIDPAETLTENNPAGRILIIEDRAESVAWFSSALAPTHEVASVDTFEETLVRVKGGDFDLIVVSLGMRGFDGLRLCSQLRSLPEGRHVPILVVVSDGDRRKLTQALEMAITDQLTGLHNRRYMSRHLDTLLSSAKKNDRPLAFVIMDIDFFKQVNDTYGHDMGDEVLKEFATRINANVRGLDLAFACNIAERLRQSIETTPIKISRAPGTLSITISIGIAKAEGQGDTAEALLHRADQALYRAKRSGRNRVVADAA